MVTLKFILTVLSALTLQVFAAPVELPRNATYLVRNLPGLTNIREDERPLMYAGHIEVDHDRNTNYFFWKFIKPETSFNEIIIWLNGGPGCSSMDGSMMETGPLRVNSEGSLDLNRGSWYDAADMIFVDQPGGTGFSTTDDYAKDLEQVATVFLSFLKKYLAIFPQDQKKEIYLAGESYAGQFIPFIGDAIMKSNDDGNSSINLMGLLIGNGWIAPDIQSLSYIPFALDSGLIKVNDSFMPQLLKDHEKCQNLLNNDHGDKFSYDSCELILNRILQYTRDKSAPKDQQCLNMYDFRLKDSYPSCGMNWPSLLDVKPFLQRADVLKSLNLNIKKVKPWRECDADVFEHLKNFHTRPSFELLPGLLERLKILLFNGDKDIICNNRGTLDTIAALSWGGSTGFTDDAIEYDWYYDGNIAGTLKADKNLTFINVHNSSHMVPFDKPFESRGLFDIFVGNYKIVNQSDSKYLETPVYIDAKISTDDKNSPEKKNKTPYPFILYIFSIVSIGGIIFYFNKNRPPKSHSILKNKSSRSNSSRKTVSWADENEIIKGHNSNHNNNFNSFFNNHSKEPIYQRIQDNEYEPSAGESFEMQSTLNNYHGDHGYDFEIHNKDVTDVKSKGKV